MLLLSILFWWWFYESPENHLKIFQKLLELLLKIIIFDLFLRNLKKKICVSIIYNEYKVSWIVWDIKFIKMGILRQKTLSTVGQLTIFQRS